MQKVKSITCPFCGRDVTTFEQFDGHVMECDENDYMTNIVDIRELALIEYED